MSIGNPVAGLISLAPMNALKDRLALAMEGPPKVTQSGLARAVKVAQSSVNGWLSGDSKSIRGGTLMMVARYLNVSPDWLANGKGQMRNTSLVESAIPVSVSTRRDAYAPEVIAEAEYWVRFEEGTGVQFQPVRRAERLMEFCQLVAESGGRLPPELAGQFIQLRQDAQGQDQHGNDASPRRRGKDK